MHAAVRGTMVGIVLPLLGLVTPAAGKTIMVGPGNSIQQAVDRAGPGDTVMVLPGTYHEGGRPCPSDATKTCAVVIDKDNIALIARSSPSVPVLLVNPASQDRGIEVARQGVSGATCLTNPAERVEGSLVRGFTVNGFDDDGILLMCVDHWKIERCSTNDNLEYGIFPSHCGPGRVTTSAATGSNDTGIYIGQSHEVRIDHNVAIDNVSGFEIENSANVELDHNRAFGNTAGILTFALPFLDVKVNTSNHVHHNLSTENNRPNTCLNPADVVCQVPPGSGLLAVAADQNEMVHNVVTGNNTVGIAVVSFCVLMPQKCGALDIDPNPEDNVIAHNVALGNGANPSIVSPLAVDLAWDGTGTGNCWDKNKFATEFPSPLPACR